MEASDPQKPGNRADLRSMLFQSTGPRCINFWVNMNGQNIGRLLVKVVPGSNINATGTKIWEITQELGQNWILGSAPFSSKVPYYVSKTRYIYTRYVSQL